jgi:transposase
MRACCCGSCASGNYSGGHTILKDWLQPQRKAMRTVAVRRFETPPGKQARVDWGHLGTLEWEDQERRLWAFTFTLGYSRTMMAEVALGQKIGTLLRMHEQAFRQMGGAPEEMLYDRMKTVWLGSDERGEIVWHSVLWILRGTGDARRGCTGRIERRPRGRWSLE